MPTERIQLTDEFGTIWNVRRNESSAVGAPVLICLHGFTGSGEDFMPLLSAIREDTINSIRIDLPGHGESSVPDNIDSYGLENVLNVLNRIILTEGKNRPVYLIGYSMGARIALHYLVRYPATKSILIGGSPGLDSPIDRSERIKSDVNWIQKLESPNYSIEDFCSEWESQEVIAPQTNIAEPYWSEVAARRRRNRATGLINALKAWGTGALPSLWDRIPELGESLLIVGDKDYKFCQIAMKMQKANAKLLVTKIPDVEHSPHLEAPERTAEVIRNYFSIRD